MLETSGITAASKEVPVVLVARRSRITSVDSVSNDDPTGAGLVVQHLADLGHRRIAHIDGGGGAGAAERRKGYERSMARRGLEDCIQIVPGAYTDEGGDSGIAQLFDSPQHPTAVFVANDLAALGALSALDRTRPSCSARRVGGWLRQHRRSAASARSISPPLISRDRTWDAPR
jgi:DNA-binding LacI/PurR family transcriptional regulator